MAVERIAGTVEGDVLRQDDRQVGLWHRHHAAFLTVDDRDRTAPVALPRDAPVAQAVVDLALGHWPIAARFLLQPLGDLFLGFRHRHAVEEAGIDHATVAIIGGVADGKGVRVLAFGADHGRYRESVFAGEFQVALIVRRTAEDGAGAVVHQDEVGDVNGQLPARVERVQRPHAGVETFLLGGLDRRCRGAGVLALGDEFRERRIAGGCCGREWMIGRDRQKARTEQSVGAGGENLQLAFAVGRGEGVEHEADQQALGAADPVLLHDTDFFRPALERVERFEQLLREGGDLEEPLGQLALLDFGAGAPAAAVDHLLVGEHGVIDRIPVHLRLLAFDQAGAQEIEEHALLVLVVGRVAGRDFARPIERQAHRLELRLHRRDVLIGPGLGMRLARHRGVLGRHAEGVPAHRMQHRVAHRPLGARHHVAHRVVAHVPHMDAPGRIGEHLQHVVFRPRVVVAGGEDALVVPGLLPAHLRDAGVVAFNGHRIDVASAQMRAD